MRDQVITHSKNNCHHYVRQALLSAKYLKGLMIQCNSDSTFSRQFKVKESLLELVEICKKPSLQGHLVHYLQLNGNEMLEGNKLYFQEAVICLLNNAFQAYQEHAANKLVVLIANIVEEQLQIKVVDGATGLLELNDSQNESAKLNNPLELANKGTGLQFVEGVVTNHFSGSIQIDSKLSRGTTVHCNLPLSKTK